MKTEILCIGTELLRGHINTNNAYISEKLSSIGIFPWRHVSVVDDETALENIFSAAFSESDLIIITGGLGPTFDDITRDIAGKVLGVNFITDKMVLDSITKYFADRKIRMPENNKRMAQVFEGANVIINSVGTAPGMILNTNYKNKKKIIIFLPGPPYEMETMMERAVIPYLKEHTKRQITAYKTLKIAGEPESQIEELILPIINTEKRLEGGDVTFAILARPGYVDVKIMVQGNDSMPVNSRINKIIKEMYDVLKDDIFGEDDDSLEKVVGELLSKKKKTVACAESCTGGLLCNMITNVSGCSIYFLEGAVMYTNESKTKELHVDKTAIEKFGAVSKETAEQMAEGIKKRSGSDIGISVTGIAGPGGGTQDKPVGLVYIGLYSDDYKNVWKYNFSGNRLNIKQRAVAVCLDKLRRYLS
ncbi:MAG: competence/damage-inducible protein A [Elusimicrobiota bacterium]